MLLVVVTRDLRPTVARAFWCGVYANPRWPTLRPWRNFSSRRLGGWEGKKISIRFIGKGEKICMINVRPNTRLYHFLKIFRRRARRTGIVWVTLINCNALVRRSKLMARERPKYTIGTTRTRNTRNFDYEYLTILSRLIYNIREIIYGFAILFFDFCKMLRSLFFSYLDFSGICK